MSKRLSLDTIRVKSPCGEDWNEMRGTTEVRFCSHCSRSVHDLSTMTRREAERLIADSNGRLCVRYVRLPDGRVATHEPTPFAILRRGSRLTAGAAATLTLVSLAADASAALGRTRDATHQTASRDQEPPEQAGGSGSASGRVLDPRGETIAGVDVTLTNVGTDAALEATTDEEGAFRFDDLAPGVYKVAASAQGFARGFDTYITVRANHDSSCEVTLAVGGMQGVVVISSEAQQLVDHEAERRQMPEADDESESDESEEAVSLLDAVDDGIDAVWEALQTPTDVDVRDRFGDTPLMLAAKRGDPEIVNALISARADANARNRFGVTPLMYAALNEDPAVTKMLLRAGADPNAQDQDGRTALMFAALEGRLKIVKALLAARADANATDATARSVLMYAEERDQRAIKRRLLRSGAK